MSTDETTSSHPPNSRGRGRSRGKSRGGLGKYLRARGRGHARGGRPAEWRERLVLEDEELIELDPDSEEVKAEEIITTIPQASSSTESPLRRRRSRLSQPEVDQ